MNLVTWLQRAALSDPEAVALFRGHERWASYRELTLFVARLAAGLRGRAGLAYEALWVEICERLGTSAAVGEPEA